MLQRQSVKWIGQQINYITIQSPAELDGKSYTLWRAMLVKEDDDDSVDTFAWVKVWDDTKEIFEEGCMEGMGHILTSVKQEIDKSINK